MIAALKFFTSRIGIALICTTVGALAVFAVYFWAIDTHGPAQFETGKTVGEAQAQARFEAAVANLEGLADEADLELFRCSARGGVYQFDGGGCTGGEDNEKRAGGHGQ